MKEGIILKRGLILLIVIVILISSLMGGTPDDHNQYWPQWRGPLMNGVAPHGDPPVQWDEVTNIRWKIAIPGKGLSTPVIWGDQIFLTTATPVEEKVDVEEAQQAEENLPEWRRRMGVSADKVLNFIVL